MQVPAYAVRSFLIHLGMAAREMPPGPVLSRRIQVIQGRTSYSKATPEQIEFMEEQSVRQLWQRLTEVETNTITPYPGATG